MLTPVCAVVLFTSFSTTLAALAHPVAEAGHTKEGLQLARRSGSHQKPHFDDRYNAAFRDDTTFAYKISPEQFRSSWPPIQPPPPPNDKFYVVRHGAESSVKMHSFEGLTTSSSFPQHGQQRESPSETKPEFRKTKSALTSFMPSSRKDKYKKH